MNKELKIIKVGNHWYPSVNHVYGSDISLSDEIDKILSVLYPNQQVITIQFEELHSIVEGDNILLFEDMDITKYMITDDEDDFDFEMHFHINGHTFHISSYIYTLLENQFNFGFHESIYKVYIW